MTQCDAWPVGMHSPGPRLTHRPRRFCHDPAAYQVDIADHDPTRVVLCPAHTAEVRRLYAGQVVTVRSIPQP